MAIPDASQRQKRSEYLKQWYQTEKSIIRMAGVLLLFAAALIVVFDQPGDTFTVLGLAGCVAGGLTLLFVNRGERQQRANLNFLKEQAQNSRAMMLGMGAMVLLFQFNERPLAVIVGIILVLGAGWFQWRVYKIKQFDQYFDKPAQGEHKE